MVPNTIEVRDFDPVLLAIAVLRDRIATLPTEDRNDLYELTKLLLCGDGEEQQSAAYAMREIIERPNRTVVAMQLSEESGADLEKWAEFAGALIKTEREKAGWTQEQLAAAAGLPQSHISKLENGKHTPSNMTREKIAKALGVPPCTFDPST